MTNIFTKTQFVLWHAVLNVISKKKIHIISCIKRFWTNLLNCSLYSVPLCSQGVKWPTRPTWQASHCSEWILQHCMQLFPSSKGHWGQWGHAQSDPCSYGQFKISCPEGKHLLTFGFALQFKWVLLCMNSFVQSFDLISHLVQQRHLIANLDQGQSWSTGPAVSFQTSPHNLTNQCLHSKSEGTALWGSFCPCVKMTKCSDHALAWVYPFGGLQFFNDPAFFLCFAGKLMQILQISLSARVSSKALLLLALLPNQWIHNWRYSVRWNKFESHNATAKKLLVSCM